MKFILCTLVIFFAVGCAKSKPQAGNTEVDDSGIGDEVVSNDDGGFGSSLGNVAGSGDLTSADKTALSNASSEANNVAPAEGNDLPADLLAEAQNLLKKEKNGEDVSMLKMALANKILQQCAGGVAALAPIPGQPLLGSWASVDNPGCKVEFDVVGPISGGAAGVGGSSSSGGSGQGATSSGSSSSGSSGSASAGAGGSAVYAITGMGTKADDKKKKDAKKDKNKGKMGSMDGQMTAGADGSGQVTAKPYSGRLMDQPASGSGSLTNPEATKTKYGFDPCTTKVALKTSTNPIPENYIQAMKKNGACHRKALMLMSPIFDNLFKSLDPSLATSIQGNALGM